MNKKIIDQCVKLSRDNLHKHPEKSFYPHYSFIIQGKTLIDWGTNNKEGLPPFLFNMYKSRVFENYGIPKLHSEVDAYRKVRNAKGIFDRDVPFDVINIRLNAKGELRLSAPCKCCSAFLKTVGCKNVHFSTHIGEFAKVTLL
jgi:hypothetical protein